jgi:phosphotransacetylase
MSFVESIRQRAAALDATIAFPEFDDQRVLSAAATLASRGIVWPIIVLDGSRPEARRHAADLGLKVTVAGRIASGARSPNGRAR